MSSTHYLWDFANDSYLMEKDQAGATTAVYTSEPVHYGKLISQRRGSTTSYCQFDAQGSARQLTDQAQNVSDEYTYAAFGAVVVTTGSTTNPFGYKGISGYYAIQATNDVYVRSRTYDAKVGRWLSTDPALFRDGANLFAYVGNQPLSRSDPSGLKPTIDCLGPADVGSRYIGSSERICVIFCGLPGILGAQCRWPCGFGWCTYTEKCICRVGALLDIRGGIDDLFFYYWECTNTKCGECT